jgi:type II secretory pathway component PulM
MFTWAAISSAFTNNPAVRWVAGIGAALAFAITWLALHDRKIRQIERLKAAEQTRKVADKIITKMETESDERIEKANEAADAVTGDVTSDSLRDDTAGFLFGDAGRD